MAGVVLALGGLLALVLVVVGGGLRHSTTPVRPAANFDQAAPNVVVVMTDDQSVDTMSVMPKTRRLIGDHGVTYTNSVVSFPLCCPSRATFMTGQYAHNHGVLNNQGPRGGYKRLDTEHTLPVWLSRAGYRTAFIGKFLNGYGEGEGATVVPPGWSEWYGLPALGHRSPFDFPVNENGTLVSYGHAARDYKTDVLADKAVHVIREQAGSDQPLFMWVATTAPHIDYGAAPYSDRNPEPAPRDRGRFEGRTPPHRKSVNERNVSDKPRFIQSRSRLDRAQRREIDKVYVSQLETLQAVDQLVKRVAAELRRQGELGNTVLIFTSDNGFLKGEHRIASGKSNPYEEAIGVPLLIRGPGFAHGVRSDRLVGNVDLAPTILDLASAEPDIEPDGRSLLASRGRNEADPAVLLEVFERTHGRFVGVRTRRYMYAEYDGRDKELYDLERDPEELHSVHDSPEYALVRSRLAKRLAELRNCAGATCR